MEGANERVTREVPGTIRKVLQVLNENGDSYCLLLQSHSSISGAAVILTVQWGQQAQSSTSPELPCQPP